MKAKNLIPTLAWATVVLAAAIQLTACGGGGSSGSEGTTTVASGSTVDSGSSTSSSSSGSSTSSSSSGGSATVYTIRLTWGASTEPALSGYVVYHGLGSGSYTDAVWVGATTTYDYDLSTTGTHVFAVTAVATSGQESNASNQVSISIP